MEFILLAFIPQISVMTRRRLHSTLHGCHLRGNCPGQYLCSPALSFSVELFEYASLYITFSSKAEIRDTRPFADLDAMLVALKLPPFALLSRTNSCFRYQQHTFPHIAILPYLSVVLDLAPTPRTLAISIRETSHLGRTSRKAHQLLAQYINEHFYIISTRTRSVI